MGFQRIFALVVYDWTIVRKSKEKLVEMFYFPLISLVMWGFFVVYARTFALQTAYIILAVQVFWSFAELSQSAISLQMMEDIWSRSLKDLFCSPIKPIDYLFAKCINSTLRSLLIFFILITSAYILFGVDLFSNLVFILLLAALTLVSSMGLGILNSSLILRLGAEYGFLSWSITTLVIFLSAPFYPLSVYPKPLQLVAEAIPYTWIFKLIKEFVNTNSVVFSNILVASVEAAIYFILSFPIFLYVFEKSREKGRLIRLWG